MSLKLLEPATMRDAAILLLDIGASSPYRSLWSIAASVEAGPASVWLAEEARRAVMRNLSEAWPSTAIVRAEAAGLLRDGWRHGDPVDQIARIRR